MQLSITVDDTSARAALEQARKRGPAAMEATMFLRAQDLLDLASPLVPRLSGNLWNSRFATRTSPVEVGLSAPYATAVEERHATHRNGQWKAITTATAKLTNQGSGPLEATWARAFAEGMTLSSAPARHPTAPNPGASTRVRPTGRR